MQCAPERYVPELAGGTDRMEDLSDGIMYFRASAKHSKDDDNALELDEFPTPRSLQAAGLDVPLSTFGLE